MMSNYWSKETSDQFPMLEVKLNQHDNTEHCHMSLLEILPDQTLHSWSSKIIIKNEKPLTKHFLIIHIGLLNCINNPFLPEVVELLPQKRQENLRLCTGLCIRINDREHVIQFLGSQNLLPINITMIKI